MQTLHNSHQRLPKQDNATVGKSNLSRFVALPYTSFVPYTSDHSLFCEPTTRPFLVYSLIGSS